MSIVNPDRIMCFECVQMVEPVEIGGKKHLRCFACGHAATVDKAIDDCFLFIVSSAISDVLKKNYARSYRFMPAQDDRAKVVEMRSFMVRTGRALLAA